MGFAECKNGWYSDMLFVVYSNQMYCSAQVTIILAHNSKYLAYTLTYWF